MTDFEEYEIDGDDEPFYDVIPVPVRIPFTRMWGRLPVAEVVDRDGRTLARTWAWTPRRATEKGWGWLAVRWEELLPSTREKPSERVLWAMVDQALDDGDEAGFGVLVAELKRRKAKRV